MSRALRLPLLHTLAAAAIALPLPAQDAATGKSSYSLFHRTPPDLRRPMSTDRPDRTESPYTVDAGLFQVEADVFSYRRDASTDGLPANASSSLSLAPINLKAGVLHNVDAQLIIAPYSWQKSEESSGRSVTREDGLGSIGGRVKVNLWGNDEGSTAFALMPFVSFVGEPGAEGRTVNVGIVAPFAADLGGGWGLGAMLQFESIGQRDGASREWVVVASAALGHDIIGPLAGYVELFSGSVVANGDAREVTGDLGLTLGIGDNLQLDAGVNVGLTRDAEDVNPFVGISARF